jgi:uncharacterized protein YdhG (YjbR/CyaY superfamily)
MATAKKAVGEKTKTAPKRSPKNLTGAEASPALGRPKMSAKPTTIDEYLTHVPGETRALLEQLRTTIKKLAPEVAECISYSMPAFRCQGKVIAGFAATSSGGSYYPFSGTTLGGLASELKGFGHTKSAVHFTAENPLPQALVRKLLDARKSEL